MLSTPETIRTLQRKLYAKAKQEPATIYVPDVGRMRDFLGRVSKSVGNCACPGMKNIGKPCAGKLHARFDEGGQVKQTKGSLLRHRQTKGAETARAGLQNAGTCSLLYHCCCTGVRRRRASIISPISISEMLTLSSPSARYSMGFRQW